MSNIFPQMTWKFCSLLDLSNMPNTSLDHEVGWKYTFIKLKFRPSFGLTDDGPQGEEAVLAWEAVMHDIYFLGGGQDPNSHHSDTYWGRITGTENEVMIMTGNIFLLRTLGQKLNVLRSSKQSRACPLPTSLTFK
jgi:hypothetical protein